MCIFSFLTQSSQKTTLIIPESISTFYFCFIFWSFYFLSSFSFECAQLFYFYKLPELNVYLIFLFYLWNNFIYRKIAKIVEFLYTLTKLSLMLTIVQGNWTRKLYQKHWYNIINYRPYSNIIGFPTKVLFFFSGSNIGSHITLNVISP